MNTQNELFGDCAKSNSAKITLIAHPRKLSPKQTQIMRVVRESGRITLQEATALVGGNVYHNKSKHTGALLSNMVNKGLLVREKVGVFTQPKRKP